LRLDKPAERIVSVVPSQTELLSYLGLEKEVVGITKFCIHPDKWFRSKQRVGGTKTLKFEAIEALQPDLILANKEENTQSEIEFLQERYNVYCSDISNLDEAHQMIENVGTLSGKEQKAKSLVQQLRESSKHFPTLSGKVLYFIWNNPYMVVGNATFIGHVMEKIGLENVLEDESARYVELTTEQIKDLNPDYLLLSSEPFPFQEKHAIPIEKELGIKTVLVDGEIFSWYGSRMLEMNHYFTQLAKDLEVK
jgi:ABC-type Fe3+-hydroxamate transport system substrate-binding protein